MTPCLLSYLLARQRTVSVADVVAIAQQHRIAAIDWLGLHGSDAETVRRHCDDAGIATVCYTRFINELSNPESVERGVDRVRAHLDEAVVLGSSLFMIPTPGDERDPAELRRCWVDGFSRVIPHAEALGIRICFENFPGRTSPFVTIGDWLFAHRQLPQLGLVLDTGNCFTGEDPFLHLQDCFDDIVHVHAKDFHRRSRPAPGYEQMKSGKWYAPAVPGQGDLRLTELIQQLRQLGYDKTIGIEYDGNEVSAEEALLEGLQLLR